jgi:hypothetical protein
VGVAPLAGTGDGLQPILIRGLSRAYSIDAAWSQTPLEFMRTSPDLLAPVPDVEPIAVEGTDPLYKLRLPSGRWLEGSLRWLAFQLDQFLMHQAIAAAAESLVLRAALLRDPGGARVAFAGGKGTGKSWLSIALLATGWRFEGDAYVVVRREGVVALPRTLRLNTPLRALPQSWREPIGLAPCLRCDGAEEVRAVDPLIFGNDWTLRSGRLDAILFLELNRGGRGGLLPLDPDGAFGRALDLCHGRMTGLSAAALRTAVAGASNFRLRIGSIDAAVEQVMKATSRTLTNHEESIGH